jgi:hypothetical protein
MMTERIRRPTFSVRLEIRLSLAAQRASGIQQNLILRQEDRIRNMEAEMAARETQREMDWAERQAQIEECQQANRPQVDQVVSTELGMGLSQRLNVGKLEVDVAALESLLAQRQADSAMLQEQVGQMKEHSEAQYQEELRAWASQCLAAQELGCNGPKAAELPPPPQRRNLNLAQTLMPTEIPYKRNVRMETKMDGPWFKSSNVRNVPAKGCCDGCGGASCAGDCDACSCPVGDDCVSRASPVTPVYYDSYPSTNRHQPIEMPKPPEIQPTAPVPPPMPVPEADPAA